MKSRAQIIAFDKYALDSNADLQIRLEYYQSQLKVNPYQKLILTKFLSNSSTYVCILKIYVTTYNEPKKIDEI